MDKRVLHSISTLQVVLLLSGNAFFYCIHSHSSQKKKLLKNYLNSFIYCKVLKPVICKEAKYLLKLLPIVGKTLVYNELQQFLENYQTL